MMILQLLILMLLIIMQIAAASASNSTSSIVPVVYVVFGAPPTYLLLNIELASRHNPVVVITDAYKQLTSGDGTTYDDIGKYMMGAAKFMKVYRHLCKDTSATRWKHELNCFLRWFIVQDYMLVNKVDRVFFGDGDSSVFVNVTEAFNLRSTCSAVINVELQNHVNHWVGAGEASLWTTIGINSFCAFTMQMYTTHIQTLESKFRSGSAVVDMSSLWLWWVATHRNHQDWETGRPYKPNFCDKGGAQESCESARKKFDVAFNYAKSLSLALVDTNIKVCNGLDIVARTTFDHMHGWTAGSNMSLNLDTNGVPTFVGAAQSFGGIPETFDEKKLAELEKTKVAVNTFHYQGGTKGMLPYDVCRVLLLTGSKVIKSPQIAEICSDVQKKASNNFPACAPHPIGGSNDNVCL